MITWKEVEAECGGYREGFVAVYRRHQGETIEGTKVTQASFAEHLGIALSTFNRWCRQGMHGSSASSRGTGQARTDTQVKSDVVRAARLSPDLVVDALMDAPVETRERIYHEVKQRRAGIDTSAANRKAAAASAAEAVEPLKRAANTAKVGTVADALDDLTEVLDEAIHDATPDTIGALLPEIRAAWSRFGGVLEVAEALAGVSA